MVTAGQCFSLVATAALVVRTARLLPSQPIQPSFLGRTPHRDHPMVGLGFAEPR